MKTIKNLLIIFFLSITILKTNAQNQYIILIDFTGNSCFSNPSCPNFDAGANHQEITTTGEYSYSFTDPLLQGEEVNDVTVNFYGDCSAAMEFKINDELIDTGSFNSSCECFCGAPQNNLTASAVFPDGLPNYNYGGSNFLKINYTDLQPSNRIRSFYAQVELNEPSLSTEDSKVQNTIIVFPNPTSDYLKVSDLKDNTKITIYSISGKKVKEIKTSGESKTIIETSNLAKGTYILNIKWNNKDINKKIIVNN